MILLVILAAVLAAMLAYELPRLLKSSSGSTTASASVAPTGAATHRVKKVRHQPAGGDPFGGNPLPNKDARAVLGGGADPFKGGGSVKPTPRVIPGQYVIPKHQIVIGQPGAHRVRTHGWIVILASIPTRNGHGSAVHFARRARGNVGSLSILNSSNRRPLRGGYWVVYSGPYPTLGAVSSRARSIHAAGYGTAYIRELITYR
jgi:hypothetical protein